MCTRGRKDSCQGSEAYIEMLNRLFGEHAGDSTWEEKADLLVPAPPPAECQSDKAGPSDRCAMPSWQPPVPAIVSLGPFFLAVAHTGEHALT